MYNLRKIDQVKCDVCGKLVEAEPWSALKDKGWETDETAERHTCPDCQFSYLEGEPFQKDDSEIHGFMGSFEPSGDGFEEPAINEPFSWHYEVTGREYGVLEMNMDNHGSRFVEIERESDGEKFWIVP